MAATWSLMPSDDVSVKSTTSVNDRNKFENGGIVVGVVPATNPSAASPQATGKNSLSKVFI
jgi:hypothetical protein